VSAPGLISGDELKAAAARFTEWQHENIPTAQRGAFSVFDKWFTRLTARLELFDPARPWEDSVGEQAERAPGLAWEVERLRQFLDRWVRGRFASFAERDAARVNYDARFGTEFGADVLLCESNLGKRWMRQVFHDAYYECVEQGLFERGTKPPLKEVDTKIGKRTRGEPVAMRCEQGRLHHVGKFKELEDQLSTFTGWDGKESPDRLDALVHACRFLMASERKQARITSPNETLSSTLQQLWRESASYLS